VLDTPSHDQVILLKQLSSPIAVLRGCLREGEERREMDKGGKGREEEKEKGSREGAWAEERGEDGVQFKIVVHYKVFARTRVVITQSTRSRH